MSETYFAATYYCGMATASILSILCAIHILWAFGFVWPAENSRDLARAVVGAKGIEKMPGRYACLGVAVALVIAAILTASGIGIVNSVWPLPNVGLLPILLILCLIFFGRAFLAYTNWWRQKTPEQPFARLDTVFYAPVCLAVGVGIFIICIDLAMRIYTT